MAENKEFISIDQEHGKVNISEDVITAIAAAAVTEIEGVSGFASGRSGDFGDFLTKKSQQKGLRIHVEENRVNVEVNVLLCYGVVIKDVAAKIQQAVVSAIESMADIKVQEVNVHVCGVAFEKGK